MNFFTDNWPKLMLTMGGPRAILGDVDHVERTAVHQFLKCPDEPLPDMAPDLQ